MTERPDGVLPDEVIRDPRSDAELLFVTLRPDLEPAVLEGFMRGLSDAVASLTGGEGTERAATACVGLGKRFFDRVQAVPAGLSPPPEVKQGELIDADVAVYVLCREEWRLAEFRRRLASLGPEVVLSVLIQRGFQRPDGRELGGFLDGQRNARENRDAVVFVDRDRDPSEPVAAEVAPTWSRCGSRRTSLPGTRSRKLTRSRSSDGASSTGPDSTSLPERLLVRKVRSPLGALSGATLRRQVQEANHETG